MSRLTAALAAFLPWLSLLPLGGVPAVLAQACMFAAAAHGAGQAVAGLAGRDDIHPVLAMQWGFAALISIQGLLIALGIDTVAMQITLVCALAGLHSALVIARWDTFDRLRPGAWLVPLLLLVAFAVLHVLGGAGDLGARPFDDDGHVIAQLQRLRDTGALADGVGYARSYQLGGQLALSALATLPGDVHLVRILEAVAYATALGVVLARIRPRDPASALWCVLVVITGSALAFAPLDLSACWTAVGLILALHALITDEARPPLVVAGLLAGALVALRLELAPLALAAVIRAVWPHRRERGAVRNAVLGFLLPVLPYLIARVSALPAREIVALLEPARGGMIRRIALAVAIGGVGAAIAGFVIRHSARRWLAIGAALVLAAIATGALGEKGYAVRLYWPLAISLGLIAAAELSRSATLTTGAMLGVLVLVIFIHEGREATGRTRWTRRYLELAANIEYVRHAGTQAPIAGGYASVLAKVPSRARVALWVTRPERLDYTQHRYIDLRTPRGSKLRVHRWDAHVSKLAQLLTATNADYLLLEEDDRDAVRIRESSLERFLCTPWKPACADDLEVLALEHPIVASDRGVRLIDLRRSH